MFLLMTNQLHPRNHHNLVKSKHDSPPTGLNLHIWAFVRTFEG